MNIKKIIVAISMLGASSTALAQDLGSDVFATINGQEVSSELYELIVGGSEVTPEQFGLLSERIIGNMVIAQEAISLGLEEESSVQNEIELTRLQILARAYVQKFLSENDVSESAVEARYEEFKQQAATEKEFLASHILIADEDGAKQAINDIDGDPDEFAKIAIERSTDTVSGAQGGSLGWALPSAYVPEFASAIQEMEPGDISQEPVQTQFGWHVIYVADSRNLELPPLGPERQQQILEQLRTELVGEEINRLIDKAEVVVNENFVPGGG